MPVTSSVVNTPVCTPLETAALHGGFAGDKLYALNMWSTVWELRRALPRMIVEMIALLASELLTRRVRRGLHVL